LAAGTLDVLRNTVGLTGIGLLCGAVLGGTRAWAGPVAYLMVAVYGALHAVARPVTHTPWIWPARPTHDLGAATYAGLVFTAGLVAITVRGSHAPPANRPAVGHHRGPQFSSYHAALASWVNAYRSVQGWAGLIVSFVAGALG